MELNDELNKLKRDYRPNRERRRRKPHTNNWHTKATHRIKKIRSKNAKRNQRRRKKEPAGAREARKENTTKIS